MLQTETFTITHSDNKIIAGDITYSLQPSAMVAIFVHGFKGFKDWGAHGLVAHYFAQHQINYVKFNFSHSGVTNDNLTDVTDMELFASNTPSKELFDLELVIAYTAKKIPASVITLVGHSRGGGISILKSKNDKRVAKLITWAAIDSFSSLWKKEQEAEWEINKIIEVYNARTKEYMPLNVELLYDVQQNAEKLNILQAAKNTDIPWIIIHGTDDVNVNISVAENFVLLNPKVKILKIDGANHVFGAHHPYTQNYLPPYLLKACEASVLFIKNEFLK